VDLRLCLLDEIELEGGAKVKVVSREDRKRQETAVKKMCVIWNQQRIRVRWASRETQAEDPHCHPHCHYKCTFVTSSL
jgi:hypothetical protein